MVRLTVILILLFASSAVRADLKWTATEVETAGDAEKPTAEFTFTNTGDKPVQIISAVPGCECTSAQFDSEPVAPGGKGKITATFDPGQLSGDQKLDIAVWTDAGEELPALLKWTVHLPDVLEIKPTALVWNSSELAEKRSVEIRFPSAPKTRVLKAVCDDPAFQVTKDGNKIEVALKGKPVAELSALRVTTDSKLGRLKEIKVPLAVELVEGD